MDLYITQIHPLRDILSHSLAELTHTISSLSHILSLSTLFLSAFFFFPLSFSPLLFLAFFCLLNTYIYYFIITLPLSPYYYQYCLGHPRLSKGNPNVFEITVEPRFTNFYSILNTVRNPKCL